MKSNLFKTLFIPYFLIYFFIRGILIKKGYSNHFFYKEFIKIFKRDSFEENLSENLYLLLILIVAFFSIYLFIKIIHLNIWKLFFIFLFFSIIVNEIVLIFIVSIMTKKFYYNSHDSEDSILIGFWTLLGLFVFNILLSIYLDFKKNKVENVQIELIKKKTQVGN